MLGHTEKSSDCLLWKGWIKGAGETYGVVHHNGREVLAHRRVYELAHGPIPEGMAVMHRCDNPKCINPEHLHLGTWADNNADRAKKGRSADTHAEKHPRTRLTNDDVRNIRRLIAIGGRTHRQIGQMFGVSNHVVDKIKAGKNWGSVA